MKSKTLVWLFSVCALIQIHSEIAFADCDEKACVAEYNAAKAKLNNIDNGGWDPVTEQEYQDGKKALEIHDRCACAYQSPPIVRQVWDSDKRVIKAGLNKYAHGARKLNETPELLAAFDKNYTWSDWGSCHQIQPGEGHVSYFLNRNYFAKEGIFFSEVMENKSKGLLVLTGANGRGRGFYRDKKACNECKAWGQCLKGTKTYTR